MPKIDFAKVSMKELRDNAREKLLNAEARVGKEVFKDDAPDAAFFMMKKNVWLYYTNGTTIRYEVRPDGVFKKVGYEGYHPIRDKELDNFRLACKKYLKLVKEKVYK